MSAGTLWSTPSGTTKAVCLFPFVQVFDQSDEKFELDQLRAAAAYGGVQIDLPATDNKKPEFLSKFPFGKVPAWEGADGFCLTETFAIARHSTCSIYFSSLCAIIALQDEISTFSVIPVLTTCVETRKF